jgi:SHS2 domain-containing protein
MEKYKFLEHPAELKVQSFGKDLPELFINSALAMMDYIYGDGSKGTARRALTHTKTITLKADNLESLLIDWLAEILYLSQVNKSAYIDYHIKKFCTGDRRVALPKIVAEIGAVKTAAKDEIKAVTYHELEIKQQNNMWQATVVYDI